MVVVSNYTFCALAQGPSLSRFVVAVSHYAFYAYLGLHQVNQVFLAFVLAAPV